MRKRFIFLMSLAVISISCTRDNVLTLDDLNNTKPVVPTTPPGDNNGGNENGGNENGGNENGGNENGGNENGGNENGGNENGGNENGNYVIPANLTAYYSNVDFSKSGMTLKADLEKVTTEKHTKNLSYDDIWNALKVTDLTPAGNEVYLLYGHNGVSTGQTAYTRGKNQNGGGNGQWNREHTYAKSLGSPDLGTSGPGADAHHLRSADVQWNGARGNLKFANGSGKSGKVSGGWYPGDEWKGDVARMMMYMYIRYNKRCYPTGVAIGTKNTIDANMIQMLLEWNAEDPVSPIEIQRNNYLADRSNPYAQGNRNPFIDNPHLATQIWGGPVAENKWKK